MMRKMLEQTARRLAMPSLKSMNVLLLTAMLMMGSLQTAVRAEEVKLPELKMKKAAIYVVPEAVKSKPVMSLDWFEGELKANGVQAVRIGEKELPGLADSDYDLLIMPFPVMSLECEDAVYRYLATGRTVMAVSCNCSVFKPDEQGVPQRTLRGELYKAHSRGWFAPFLIRNLDSGWKWARRSPKKALHRNVAAAGLVGDLLPPLAAPYAQLTYTPMDRWNVIPGNDGGYGKGTNYGLASDVTLPLYREHRGIPSDFFIHRYFNTGIFGGTFIQLGKVGTRLLGADQGAGVFKALLHLSEMPLPKEQPRDYYRACCQQSLRWADYSFAYIDMVAKLRDAAIVDDLNGKKDEDFQQALTDVFRRHGEMEKLRQENLDCQLKRPAAPEGRTTQAELNRRLDQADELFQRLEPRIQAALAGVRAPVKPQVTSPYQRLQLIASLTLPVNLNRLRGGFFDELRRMDGTVYSWSLHEWYIRDPQVQKKMRGISLDHKFVYGASASYCTGMGRYNPVDGTVVDAPAIPYPYKYVRDYLPKLFRLCDECGIRQFRIGTGDETGIGFNYWGELAAVDYRKALQEFYDGDVDKLNKHCGTSFRSFEEIALPLRQPRTPSEHALWEHWRRCRERKLETIYRTFHEEIKKSRPSLDVFHLPSTGSMGSPLYGLNLYNASRYEDVNGLDGTTCAVSQEWQVYDLTRRPLLTSEWGGVYTDRSVMDLYGQMWQEVTGGTLGFELHSFTWGSDSISFIDHLNLKNIRGAIVRQVMHDTRQVEHVLLDGKRAVPEIGILFSQTARVHDQGWGMKGESTRSAHMDTVSNYYGLFLKYQRSARVIPEERLVEETLPPVKCLIVPQAKYLSENVQRKLLDYARAGGILMVEGRCGQFDDFGRDSNLLFREAGIVPRYAETKTFTCGGRTFDMTDGEGNFSPTGKGETLAVFGQSPAIFSVRYGAGHIVVAGLGLGRQQYAFFPGVLEQVLRHYGVTPRLMVSDDAVLSREWGYGGDTYLMLVRKTDNWNLKSTEIKVRGKVPVEDYRYGKVIPASFQNGYTVFSTLLGVGGRIYRLKGAAPASLPYAPALAEARLHPLATSQGCKDQIKKIELPYRGRLYDETPLQWQDVVFSLTTVAAGDGDVRGETYLTVTGKGGESQKRFIEVNRDVFFRIGKRIFKIRSSNNFCKYPFHCELTIELADHVPAHGAATCTVKGTKVALANDVLSVTVDSSNEAAITSLLLKDRHSEQITNQNKKAAFTISGKVPGVFWGRKCKSRKLSRPVAAGDAGAGFSLVGEVEHLSLDQEYVMYRNQVGFGLQIEARQNPNAPTKGFEIHWHPELGIGGGAEKGDVFFIPSSKGTLAMPFRGVGAGRDHSIAQPWSAVVDTEQRLAYISAFRPGDVKSVYIWDGKDFYTVELMAPRASGEPISSRMELAFYFVRGVTGVDAWRDGLALHVPMSASVNQSRPRAFVVEAGTAYLEPRHVELKVALFRGKDEIFTWPAVQDWTVYDRALVQSFQHDLSQLPDGDYHLTVQVRDGKAQASVDKAVRLRGNQLNGLLKKYESLRKRLSSHRNDGKTFKLETDLEELRQHISACELPAAQALVRQLENSLK